MAYPAPSFRSTKETTNYARLCRLLVDVGTHVVREVFDKKRPPGNLDIVFSSPPVHPVLQSLRKKRILNPLQWGKLYPAIKSSVSSQHFDITLLMALLRNICGLVPPASGWDNLPRAADTTLEADIVRIRCYRNTVYGHASEASVDNASFNQYWKDIKDVLVRLGGAGYQGAIDDLKTETMDPDIEEHYEELLQQWVKDELSVKERLDEIKEELGKKLDDLKESVDNNKNKTNVPEVKHYHQIFQRGQVCIAGENHNVNMEMPSSFQRSVQGEVDDPPRATVTAGPLSSSQDDSEDDESGERQIADIIGTE